jgi:hypothetical protein
MMTKKQRADLTRSHLLIIDNLALCAKNHVDLCKLMRSVDETRLAELHARIARILIEAGELLQNEEPGDGKDRKAG